MLWGEVMGSKELLDGVRKELEEINQRIINHPYILDAERGELSGDKMKRFVEQQYYIVSYDARSLALMVQRSRSLKEANYFSKLMQGDLIALESLLELAGEFGTNISELEAAEILPEAVAYTHYISWLALYASPGEQAFALVVNLPVWGSGCARLGKALREKYPVKKTAFLDAFGSLPAWIEDEAAEIIEVYPPQFEVRMRAMAKLIQAYELGFWDAIYGRETD